MRAVGNAAIAIFALAGNVDLAPAGAGRDDHRPRLELRAARELDSDQLAGNERRRALQVHDVDIVSADVAIEACRELVPFGFLDRDEVLDADGVEKLSAHALGCNACTDAFARGVNRGG